MAVTEGRFKLNSTKGVGAAKLDWATLTSPVGHNGLPFALDVADTLSLHVGGNASIEFNGRLTVTGRVLTRPTASTRLIWRRRVAATAGPVLRKST